MVSAIIRPTHKPYYAPAWKIPFINLENLFMGVNKVHIKYYSLVWLGLWLRFVLGLLCQLGLVLRLGSV